VRPDEPLVRKVEHAVEQLVDRVDEAVPDDAVAPDDRSRLVHWAGPVFAVLSLVMVPWTVYLAMTLPDRSVSGHYAVAWAGFDVLLTAGLVATAWTAMSRSAWLAIAASSTATLLVIDAWFDVVTSPTGAELVAAAVLAVLVEVPLAGLCGWLARHSEQLVRAELALRLPGRRPRPGA
jgi:hypothetical protein